MLSNGYHLTYCTNIHPGESWQAVFNNLKSHVPPIKGLVSPEAPFGIGLRLSNRASLELFENKAELVELQAWLERHECYVFTLNGFPYGEFHHEIVKDKVHSPDWSTKERLSYTLRLANILATLLPESMDGGISTSPLSYKYWHTQTDDVEAVKKQSALNLAAVAAHLYQIKRNNGKEIHLDLEPEPDGLLENTRGTIRYFQDWLMPIGCTYLERELGLTQNEAKMCLSTHIRICYDICHFAVEYENSEQAFRALADADIRIGKIQISAALKFQLNREAEQNETLRQRLQPFAECIYLHQVVAQGQNGALTSFPDLSVALKSYKYEHLIEQQEWRTHFHVPIFLSNYGTLSSTQDEILQVLEYLREKRICSHLEVETYTWGVLPKDIQLDVDSAIVQELQWVKEHLEPNARIPFRELGKTLMQ